MGLQTRVGTEGRIPQRIGRFRILKAMESDGHIGGRTAADGARRRYLASADDGSKAVVETFGPADSPEAQAISEEAAAYARLTHPGVVRVVDTFVGDEGVLAIATEAVDGTTLDVFRVALERKQQNLGHASWVYVASCAFDALAAAHASRSADGHPSPILHRGIAPSSIHLVWNGGVKLGGFDLGNTAGAARDSSRVQRAPSRYLAPEQTKLQPSGPQADVYSLTLVLWELLTKRKISEAGARPLDALDGEIETGVRAVIQAGLEPEPTKRTLGAARAAALLRAAVDGDEARRDLSETLSRMRLGGASVSQVSSITPSPVAAPTPPPIPVSSPPPVAPPTPPPLPVSTPVARPDAASESSAAQTMVKELSLAQTSFAQPPPELPARRPSSAELAQTSFAQPPAALPARRASAAELAQTSLAQAPAVEPSASESRTTVLSSEAQPPAPPRTAEAPEVSGREGDSDRWFQTLRPPTPGSFPSPLAGTPADGPQVLSSEERERLDRRRRLGRTALFACMAGSLCIVLAAVAVRARAAVTAPHAASIESVTPHAGPLASAPPSTSPPSAGSPNAAAGDNAAAVPAPTPAPSTVARAAPIPHNMGELRLPPTAAGHRLIVDNRAVGEAASRVRIACGRHVIRIGSGGRKVSVDVPCGGSIAVNP